MEKALLSVESNGKNNEWVRARIQSKETRLQCTDVIKDFVEYATAQGSKSAKFYYKHITNATYSALGLIQHKKPKIRDKAVFVLVKLDLIAFSETLFLSGGKEK